VPAAPDLIAPANNIWTNDNTPLFNWSFNDLDSKQAVFQVLIDNDNEFNSIDYDSDEQTSGNNYWQFPIGTNYNSISDGTWYWKVRTRDNDGDWGVYSTSYRMIIDTKVPNSKIIVPKDNEYYNYLDVISGTASDTKKGSIVSKVEIAIYNLNDNSYWNGSNWVEEESWLLASGTTDWLYDSISINWSSCHQYQIRSRATDNATNIEIPGNGNTFYFDSDDPISTIENPKNNSWLNHLNIISGSANDPGGSGIDRAEICIKNINFGTYWDGKSWVETIKWVTASQTETWSYNTSNIKWSTDTEYYVNSRASDKVGNKEFPGPKNIFRFDYEPPEQLSILINDGAEYTNSTQVRLSLHAEDYLSGINQMAFSTNNIKWSVWELFNTTKSFTLLAGDGKKTIYFKVRDYANNTAVPISDSIILDTAPPCNLSILINNGTSETDSIYVILKLNATDDTSGVYQMAFSTDGNNWSDWENFTNTKSYILSDGDGIKTVYFKVKDRAGNFGESVETNITLTTLDTDNDGYPDSTDAFPNNPQYHLDTDSDDMPDAWENKYGLNKYDPNDANVDSDNDGKSNLDEFINGTDPTEKNVKDGKEEDYIGYIIGAIIVLIIIIFLYILKSRRDDKSKEDKIGKAKSATKLPSDKSQEKACEDERI
ncbi:MAG: hypothetical protein KAJ51_15365, partial [Thermoplasmata archaeon]|nr:hypothetical protein [Thermoplasmata archaeon]